MWKITRQCVCSTEQIKQRLWAEYKAKVGSDWVHADYPLFKEVLGDPIAWSFPKQIRERNPNPAEPWMFGIMDCHLLKCPPSHLQGKLWGWPLQYSGYPVQKPIEEVPTTQCLQCKHIYRTAGLPTT